MSYNFSINSSEDNICYVTGFLNHRSILLLKNTSATSDVILQNININLNFKNNKKENLIVLWRILKNPITNITPTWVSPHANSISQYSSQNLTITMNTTTEILLSGYIDSTLTLNVDTILNNKVIGQNDIVGLTLEYVGNTIQTQNPSVGAMGSLTWSEGPLLATGPEALMISSLSNLETSSSNIETSNNAIQTSINNIDNSNAAIQTSISNLETINAAIQTSLSNLETINSAVQALLTSIDASNTTIAESNALIVTNTTPP